jgi:hypothetical protein
LAQCLGRPRGRLDDKAGKQLCPKSRVQKMERTPRSTIREHHAGIASSLRAGYERQLLALSRYVQARLTDVYADVGVVGRITHRSPLSLGPALADTGIVASKVAARATVRAPPSLRKAQRPGLSGDLGRIKVKCDLSRLNGRSLRPRYKESSGRC